MPTQNTPKTTVTTSIILRTRTDSEGTSIALACFKIASKIPQNGFVPRGEAIHAADAITGT
jgi:hypothetical protein